MSTYEMLMLFWLLPFLITFFLCIQIEKIEDSTYKSKLPADIENGEWVVYLILSSVYPIGFLFLLFFVIGNYGSFLTKELW